MSRPLETAALVAVGDELLEGKHPDLNSAVLARELAFLGIATRAIEVHADDEDALAERLVALAAAVDLVVITGGLGPTLDDITRHAVARAVGSELETSAEALEQANERFLRSGRTPPAGNARQALIPEGSRLLPNARGTAPGFVAVREDAWIACLPGPPVEMEGMLQDELLPYLRSTASLPAGVARAQFHLFGLPESEFSDRAGDWMARDADPLMAVTAKDSVLSVRLVARAADAELAAKLLDARREAFRERFATWIFSERSARPEDEVGEALLELGRPVAVAESCTGGMVAAALTRIPGISAVFRVGFVTYSNESKERELGVPRALLDAHGAVSEEVAEAMAAGAARTAEADLAVSITGIAGPGGGSAEKPVGTVCFGVYAAGESSAHTVHFAPAERERLRARARHHALLCLGEAARGLTASS